MRDVIGKTGTLLHSYPGSDFQYYVAYFSERDIKMLKQLKCICFLVVIFILFLLSSCSKNDSLNQINWLDDLEYTKSEIYDITFSKNGIPQIPIKINDNEFDIQFDTGNSGDLLLTTTIESKIKYKLIKNDKTYNGDGSYRGDIKRIQIDKLAVFNETYNNISGAIGDWKIYSGNKFNGNIGLNYFIDKRVTLDYKSKKIAISSKKISNSDFIDKGYSIVPLIKPTREFGELLFVEGIVNGKKTIVYLDTGIMPSHVDQNIASGLDFIVDKKSKYGDFNKQYKNLKITIGDFSFETDQIYEHNINMNTNFEEPIGIVLGSDILKNFILTIDKQENRLILKNNI